MRKNIGSKDRLFRLGLGVFFIGLALVAGTGEVAGQVLLITGCLSVLSGACGYCLACGLHQRACKIPDEGKTNENERS